VPRKVEKEDLKMRPAKKLTMALLVLVASAAFVACGSSDDSTTKTSGGKPSADNGDVPTIVVRNGEPVGGVQELEFTAGEDVRFRVSSDQAEEIHVHGYDISQDVSAGGTTEFDFPAEIEGIFEAELEELGIQIVELRINP
jgi:hypothetical protein